RFSLTSESPICERLGNSESFVATGALGTSIPKNNFDNIYPYNEMRLCNVLKTDWGATKITYQGDPNFTRDGTNGEVMLEIPKIYVKRYQKDGYEYLYINGQPLDGYVLDP